MGKIKTAMIKRASRELLARGDLEFDTTFEHNKSILGHNMPSKKTRNKIAGYIARLNQQKTAVKKEKPKVTEVPQRDENY
jgi:ribosomal protein S17E